MCRHAEISVDNVCPIQHYTKNVHLTFSPDMYDIVYPWLISYDHHSAARHVQLAAVEEEHVLAPLALRHHVFACQCKIQSLQGPAQTRHSRPASKGACVLRSALVHASGRGHGWVGMLLGTSRGVESDAVWCVKPYDVWRRFAGQQKSRTLGTGVLAPNSTMVIQEQ